MDKDKIVETLIKKGAEITGGVGSAVIGALAEGIEGGVLGGIGGPLISYTFESVGFEVKRRLHSPREEMRIGAAYVYAYKKIKENQENGKLPRDDGFFEDDKGKRSASSEILEGIIIKCQREYEEQKVQFLGNLFANICFDQSVSKEYAHQLIKTANALSFRQYCMMRLLQERHIESQRKKHKYNFKINAPDLLSELRDLLQRGLITAEARWNDFDDITHSVPADDFNINDFGLKFCDYLSLNEIELGELQRINSITNLMPY